MNTRHNSRMAPRFVRCAVVAAALALPGLGAFAESMDSVKLRSDQSVDRPGRDSIHAPAPTIVATPPQNPQHYGRAGGYVAAERAVVVESAASQSSTVVKTGESEVAHIAQARTEPEMQVDAGASTPMPQPGTGHEGDRFGDPNGIHGQGQAVQ